MRVGYSAAFMVNQEVAFSLNHKRVIDSRQLHMFRLLSHSSNLTFPATTAETYEVDELIFVKMMDKELKDLQMLNDALTLPASTYQNANTNMNEPERSEGMSSINKEVDNSVFVKTTNQELTNLQMLHNILTLTSSTFQNGFATANGFEQDKGISDVVKARLLLVCASMLYGTNFSLVKLLGDTMPVGVSSALRFGLAAVFTAPWLMQDLYEGENLGAAWLGFEVGLWNSVGYVSQAVGLETTAASKSAFICSLAVVVVPIIDFFTGKVLHVRQWTGAVLAIIGVAFLELGSNVSSQMSMRDMLSFVQPFAFGVGFWKMERAMQQYPDQACRMTAAQLLAVFSATIVYGVYTIDPTELQSFPWLDWLHTPSLLISLFWTGVITTALTIYMENVALETLSAAETTLIFSTEPIWGTAFAAVVVGEQLGFNAGVGASLILIACIYSSIGLDGISSLVKDFDEESKFFLVDNLASSRNSSLDER